MELKDIKYRFWDMSWPDGFTHSPKMSPVFTFHDLLRLGSRIVLAMDKGLWIPMQFSGLTDRDGVDMFEGDILEHTIETPDGFRVVRGAMYFNKQRAQFGVEMEVQEGDPIGDHFEVKESVSGRPKVIGNIYDNPDLLKKK